MLLSPDVSGSFEHPSGCVYLEAANAAIQTRPLRILTYTFFPGVFFVDVVLVVVVLVLVVLVVVVLVVVRAR